MFRGRFIVLSAFILEGILKIHELGMYARQKNCSKLNSKKME